MVVCFLTLRTSISRNGISPYVKRWLEKSLFIKRGVICLRGQNCNGFMSDIHIHYSIGCQAI